MNLTHDESSSIELESAWVNLEEFNLGFRFTEDGQEDLEIVMVLTPEELAKFVLYLEHKLSNHPKFLI